MENEKTIQNTEEIINILELTNKLKQQVALYNSLLDDPEFIDSTWLEITGSTVFEWVDRDKSVAFIVALRKECKRRGIDYGSR